MKNLGMQTFCLLIKDNEWQKFIFAYINYSL